jgi:hypothetical protein
MRSTENDVLLFLFQELILPLTSLACGPVTLHGALALYRHVLYEQ